MHTYTYTYTHTHTHNVHKTQHAGINIVIYTEGGTGVKSMQY